MGNSLFRPAHTSHHQLFDLIGNYLINFRDSFFVIDSKAKVLCSDSAHEPFLKKELLPISNLKQIFPQILSFLADTQKNKQVILENTSLDLLGEILQLDAIFEGLYIVVVYNTRSIQFMLDLLNDRSKEFIRNYLSENTKQILLFTEEIEKFHRFLTKNLLKKEDGEDFRLQEATKYIQGQIDFFKHSYQLQHRYFQQHEFTEDDFADYQFISLPTLLLEMSKFIYPKKIELSNADEFSNFSFFGNRTWITYTFKNILQLLKNQFLELDTFIFSLKIIPYRAQIQFQFHLDQAVDEHLEIFFYSEEKTVHSYELCRHLAEINRGKLYYDPKGKNLIFSLPSKAKNQIQEEIFFLIGDSDAKNRKLISDLVSRSYAKAKKFEASSADNFFKLLVEIRPNCVLLDPFFHQEKKEDILDFFNSLFRNQVDYKPKVFLHAEYAKVKDFLLEISQNFDITYVRKEVSEVELQIIINQALVSIRNFKIISDLAQTAQKASDTDRLTGAFSRSFYEELIQREILRAQKNKTNLHLIVTDIDYFKNYNDLNGHLAGDQLLREFVGVLKDNIRTTDYVARYGGEEFVILLLNAPNESAMIITEKIRQAIADYHFAFQNKQPNGNLTASFGVAALPKDGTTAEDLFAVADKRLYQAKRTGRNKVVGF